MLCKTCIQPLANTHVLGGCKYNTKLRISTHNITFKLLHELLQTHKGGRWPIFSMDLGNKPVKKLQNTNALKQNHHTRRPYTTIHRSNTRRTPKRKNKYESPHHHAQHNPSKHKRPKHHKPDIIRAIGYIINSRGTIVADPTYRGRRCLQLI